MLYPNLCYNKVCYNKVSYNKVCYKGPALYVIITRDIFCVGLIQGFTSQVYDHEDTDDLRLCHQNLYLLTLALVLHDQSDFYTFFLSQCASSEHGRYSHT